MFGRNPFAGMAPQVAAPNPMPGGTMGGPPAPVGGMTPFGANGQPNPGYGQPPSTQPQLTPYQQYVNQMGSEAASGGADFSAPVYSDPSQGPSPTAGSAGSSIMQLLYGQSGRPGPAGSGPGGGNQGH